MEQKGVSLSVFLVAAAFLFSAHGVCGLDCSTARATPSRMNVLNTNMPFPTIHVIGIRGARMVTVTAVTQDEPVCTNGVRSARLRSSGAVQLRNTMNTGSNGRVYTLTFTATDSTTSCTSTVTVCATNDLAVGCVDDTARSSFDALAPCSRTTISGGGNPTPTCAPTQPCGPNKADCDGQAGNSCEVDIAFDPRNCGACGAAVSPVANAVVMCFNGSPLVACNTGFTNCGGVCVNIMTSTAHCGVCGRAVPSVPSATSTCVNGVPSFTCITGYTNCDGSCVNLLTDQHNCGSCGNTVTSCINGAAACAAGLTSCGGTCVNLMTDPSNCGVCGRVLPSAQNGVMTCVSGTGALTCSSGYTNCGGTCVDLTTDTNNCGACGRVVVLPNAVTTCVAGSAHISQCNTGYSNCNGVTGDGCEVNIASDVNNCGMCGRVASVPNGTPGCMSGAVTIASCNTGFGNCDGQTSNGCEVNIASDVNNCGACGLAIFVPNGTPGCVSSTGTVSSCNAGFGNCNGLTSDGCEINLYTNTNNCGVCGRVAVLPNATAGCVNGTPVVLACNAGFANCDGLSSNGCEKSGSVC